MLAYDPSSYHRYPEMTRLLHAWAEEYPGLCRLESAGRSPEGREVWAVTLTNFATGGDRSKPGYHMNGQHHAGEVTAGAVAMYTIQYLLAHYGRDPKVTELLDTRSVYVMPRLAVDGAEWYFDNPQIVRSSPLMYPEPEEPEGLRPEDVNGDGQILQMRIPDPNGAWKVSDRDPRLMVRRRTEDREGQFYRIYTEGLIKRRTPRGIQTDWDGRGIGPDPGGPYARERYFDFNRNYPTNWKPQHRQPGSGRYPFDRPEVRALAEFWLSRPNIGAAMSYHTYSGMNLRPSPLVPDDKLDAEDLALFKALGETCRRVTGYPTVSVYEYFTSDYNPDHLDVGSWLEWCYDEQGVQGFEMELWDWPYIAGVEKKSFKEQKQKTPEQREEDELRKLQWNDSELNGLGFTPWTPFDHPQLGRVEIGGWDPKFVIQNPPAKFLHDECHKNCLFAVEHALALPLLRVGEVRVKPLGAGLYSLDAEVVNRGFLPTCATRVAVQMKRTRPVEMTLTGAAIQAGKPTQELGQIDGRGCGEHSVWGGTPSPVTSAWAQWVVRAEPGAVVTISVRHDRGGCDSREVRL